MKVHIQKGQTFESYLGEITYFKRIIVKVYLKDIEGLKLRTSQEYVDEIVGIKGKHKYMLFRDTICEWFLCKDRVNVHWYKWWDDHKGFISSWQSLKNLDSEVDIVMENKLSRRNNYVIVVTLV